MYGIASRPAFDPPEKPARAVRAMPVLFACQGCPEFGQTARDVGTILDQQRLCESHWIGAPACNSSQLVSTARARFPVYALDGCAQHCAQRWLAGHGVRTQRHFILEASGEGPVKIAQRIASLV